MLGWVLVQAVKLAFSPSGEDFGALSFSHLGANRSCIQADAFFLERLGFCNRIGEGLRLLSRDITFVLADPNTCGDYQLRI